MKVYLLDFDGALSTLRNPGRWVDQQRAASPEDRFVIWSGNTPDILWRRYKALLKAVDAFWVKPLHLTELFRQHDWEPTEIIVVDNSPAAGRLAQWMLRTLGVPVRVVGVTEFGEFFE